MAWRALAFGAGIQGSRVYLTSGHLVQRLTPAILVPSSTPAAARNAVSGSLSGGGSMGLSSRTFSQQHWFHSSPRVRVSKKPASQPQNPVPDLHPSVVPQKKSKRGGAHPIIYHEWPPEMDARIIEMRLEGSTWEEIGEAIGRIHSQIRLRYMKKLDPALHRGWTPERIEYLNTSVARKMTWRQISEELLMSQTACRAKWISLNADLIARAKRERTMMRLASGKYLPGRPPALPFHLSGMVGVRRTTWCKHMDALLVDFKSRGLNWKQIGSLFGMMPMTCYARYQQHIVPRLRNGWVPPTLDTSNVPYYLLPDRKHQPAVGTSNASIPGSSGALSETGEARKTEIEKLAVISSQSMLRLASDEYLYNTHEDIPTRTWTQEEDDFIVQSRENEVPFKHIGGDLGIDPQYCHHRYFTVLHPRLKNITWTPTRLEKLLYYVEQGLSWSTIANDLGFHRTACKQKYKEITQPYSSSTGTEEGTGHSTHHGALTTAPDLLGTPSGHEDDRSLELEGDGDNVEQDSNNVVEDLGDEKEEDIDGSGEVDEDLLDSESPDLEDTTEDSFDNVAGGWSGKQDLAETSSVVVQNIWDKDSKMREIQKTWTPEDETVLIQHVIRNGTRGWQEVSHALDNRHSAEECRAYWKYLDMPVREPKSSWRGCEWKPLREAQFWRLWLENGSDFEAISKRMNKESEMKMVLPHRVTNTITTVTPDDCRHLFEYRTQQLRMVHGEKYDHESFQKDCAQLALQRSVPKPFTWDKESSVKLQKLVRQRLKTRGVQVDWVNWKWVARHIGGVTAFSCSYHWRSLRTLEFSGDAWTEEELMLLEQGVREIGSIFNDADNPSSLTSFLGCSSEPSLSGFKAISKFYLPHRTPSVIQRKFFLLSDRASKVTLDEYMAIMDAVDEHGMDQWDVVARSLPTSLENLSSSSTTTSLSSTPTTASSSSSASLPSSATSVLETTSKEQRQVLSGWRAAPCRRVWKASYKHHLLYTQWTPEEDEDLKKCVELTGQKEWIAVSRFFPGKSAWQCRLRWCQLTDPVQPASSASPPLQSLSPPLSQS
ncbi:hypothetical protein BGX34_004167 [Mortierella sp. NVP85]|nr:hypothetical protein BGX34_004167 [Mortierella sp. NVP85]